MTVETVAWTLIVASAFGFVALAIATTLLVRQERARASRPRDPELALIAQELSRLSAALGERSRRAG